MKKALLTLALLAATLFTAWAGKPEKLERLAKQYKNEDGFEMVSMGRLGMSLFRGVVSLSGDLDDEDREALKLFTGLNKLIVIDFEDIPAAKKEAFAAKVERILSGMELILEAKDEGDFARIYGIDNGNKIRDCVLYSSDGTLIVTRGSLSLKNLRKLVEIAD